MKTYRTIDLLKKAYDGEIFKNKFRNIKTGKEIEQGKTSTISFFYVDTGENIFNIISNFVTISVNKILKQEWEEVQQPIRFTEAVEALNVGETIYCQYINSYTDKEDVLITNIYEPNATNDLRNQEGEPPTLWQMLHAGWYIKGVEE